jgi:hypothetical protein
MPYSISILFWVLLSEQRGHRDGSGRLPHISQEKGLDLNENGTQKKLEPNLCAAAILQPRS